MMSESKQSFPLEVEGIKAVCPLGEVVGNEMIAEERIPVISCEGGCFRGEIARVASHMVAREAPYSRGCHGEMFTAPRSAMAEWARKARKVVVIDGCFMRCHGRIMKNIVGREKMIQFDAFRVYNKGGQYSDTMLVDEIPEAERTALARQVADEILASLRDATPHDSGAKSSCGASEPDGNGAEPATRRTAGLFVDQMRRDHAFRTAVRSASDEVELNGILRNHRFRFQMNELAKAMASCMDQLEKMETNRSQG